MSAGAIDSEEMAPEETPPPPKPWKDEGYPAFSKWMASSEDFLILRRFRKVNTRALLYLQNKVARLEEDLDNIDASARQMPDEFADSGTFRGDPLAARTATMERAIPLLQQYNEFLVTYSQVNSWSTAQKYHTQNLDNWFWNHRGAICEEEQEFASHKDDLVAVLNRPKTPLRQLIEKFMPLLDTRLFRSAPREQHVSSPTTVYLSNKRLDAVVFGVVITLGLLLLLGPMWTLHFVVDGVKRLGIITGFIFLFTALLSSATIAKPFEVLAATAAYAAVLMVFLQMSGGEEA
ncbi:hypothetical protein B0T16DRAFT_460373 [Cercophora newfieldiana]|uniref:DUF6594 domain-containing protein n=1 Tax=Cercophora newfieldiana TaxID=92897 RepID=A0AA40CMD1_9PEZI|nr:hypothetical protein B0T16DRAFT_460373 [Cercophora newfieldiana]